MFGLFSYISALSPNTLLFIIRLINSGAIASAQRSLLSHLCLACWVNLVSCDE